MKSRRLAIYYVNIVFIGLILWTPFSESFSVYGQFGSNISGHVFGLERRPMPDVHVELLDDLNRSIARTRTNGAGRYVFPGLGSGRFKVRVMPFGTDYEEQEQEVEIVSFTSQTSSGTLRQGGFSSEQKDFYLRLQKGTSGTTGTIFAQVIPDEAKKLYEKAVLDLNDKKEKEGLAGLKSAIEAFPKYYVALERLGTEYVRLGHFEAAYILLSVAVDINPRGYRSWFGLAHSLYSLNKIDEGLTAIQKAIEIYPRSAEAFLLSGVLLRKSRRFDEAEKRMVKAKELAKETNPQIYWHLALLYGNDLKRYREAAKELKTFLRLQPDTQDAEKIKKLIAEFEEKARTSS